MSYLETLVEIGVEKNTTIGFPLPMDLLSGLALRLGATSLPNALAEPEPATASRAAGLAASQNGERVGVA